MTLIIFDKVLHSPPSHASISILGSRIPPPTSTKNKKGQTGAKKMYGMCRDKFCWLARAELTFLKAYY